MGDQLEDLYIKVEALKETNARRTTPARTQLIEGIEARIWALEHPGQTPPKSVEPEPEPEPEPAPRLVTRRGGSKAAASPPKEPARNQSSSDAAFDEDIDAALAAQTKKKVVVSAAASRSPSAASTPEAWAIDENAPAQPAIVVWDLNHALIPHYQLKRHEDGPELFDAWAGLSQELQALLPPLQVGNMRQLNEGRHKQQAIALYSTSDQASLLKEPEVLSSLESDTNAALGGQLQAVKEALNYVVKRGGCNVVITSSQLKPTAAKLLVYGMAPLVPIDLIYCAGEGENKGKLMAKAFSDARSTIGGAKSRAQYIFAAKGGRTEAELAKLARAEHCPITCPDDLMNLRRLIDGQSK